MPPLVIIASLAVAASLPLLWWSVSSARSPNTSARSNLSHGLSGATDLRQLVLSRSASERTIQPLGESLKQFARRMTPSGLVESLEKRIILAGRPEAWPIERVLAAKLILAAMGLLVGVVRISSAPGRMSVFLAIIAVAAGYFIPDLLLSARGKNRQLEIQLKLPDTLDQLMICVEAGLGFEAALARAGRTGTGPLADEIVRTLQEMQVGSTRAQALRNLTARTDVPELRRFVLALQQAEAYGMPLADVLRTQSAELRVKRRQRAEEHAMKIPVKVIFPLVFCILPTLFIVILGPAGIRMARFLGGTING